MFFWSWQKNFILLRLCHSLVPNIFIVPASYGINFFKTVVEAFGAEGVSGDSLPLLLLTAINYIYMLIKQVNDQGRTFYEGSY